MTLLVRALRRDRLVLTLALVVSLSGVAALSQMPKQEDPSFPYRAGIITAALPGADAETIARLVARPLEREIAQVEGVDEIRTVARQNVAVISVQLDDGLYDTDPVWTRVRAAMARAGPSLPAGAQPPLLDDRVIGADVAVYGIVGGDALAQRQAALRLRDRLSSLAGVAETRLSGDPGESVRIELDRAQLLSLGLSPAALGNAIASRSEPATLGAFSAGGRSVPVLLDADYADLEAIAAVPVPLASGGSLPLGSIATIRRDIALPARQRGYVDGEPTVAVEVRAARNSVDVLQLGEVLRAEVSRFAIEIAPLQVIEIFYQPQFTRERLSGLLISLSTAIGLILLVLVMAMGLRPALVVAAILPLVTATSIAIYAIGGGVLQQIAVIGMVVALGILVDNAIVIVEGIQRRLDAGERAIEARDAAVRELAAPLLAATGTTVAAFLPLLLSSGTTADFTRGIPVAITLSLVASYLFATLVTPLLSAKFLRPRSGVGVGDRRDGRLTAAFVALYDRYPRPSALAGLVLLVGSLATLPLLEQQFFPDADRTTLLVELRLSEGSHIDATDAVAQEVERHLREDARVGRVDRFVGYAGPTFYYNLQRSPQEPARARLLVQTQSLQHNVELVESLRSWADRNLPGVELVPVILRQGPPAAAPIEMLVFQPDRARLAEAVDSVTELLGATPGTRNVRHSLGQGVIAVAVERPGGRAAQTGTDEAAVADWLAASSQGLVVGNFRAGEDSVPIRLHLQDDQTLDMGRLEGSPVEVIAGVPLAQVARMQIVLRPGSVERRDQRQMAVVSSELLPGYGFGGVMAELRRALGTTNVPEGTEIRFGGEAENAGKANDALVRAAPIGILTFLFFVLLQFNSLTRAGLVLSALPFAMAGVFPALLVAGLAFGFQPLQGVIALIGITINNSILLVSAVDQRLERGLSLDEAVREALRRRLRPILLTTATTTVGLLPLAWSNSTLWPPLAWAMIGGLIASAWLCLTVLPIMVHAVLGWRLGRATKTEDAAISAPSSPPSQSASPAP
jgi:multidrug efflux pump subunit AcrB